MHKGYVAAISTSLLLTLILGITFLYILPTYLATQQSTLKIQAAVEWFRSNYNPDLRLLRCAPPGSGQISEATIGYSGPKSELYWLIGCNFLASRALEPYLPDIAGAVTGAMNGLLRQLNYTGNDRREVFFGTEIPFPLLATETVVVRTSSSPFYSIVTELPSSQRDNFEGTVDGIVSALLEQFLAGNTTKAHGLFDQLVSWWDGMGFIPDLAGHDTYDGRSLALFLFAERATKFSVSESIVASVQHRLLGLQLADGSVAVGYKTNGEAIVQSSGETTAMALLAYDPRIQKEWFPTDLYVDDGSDA